MSATTKARLRAAAASYGRVFAAASLAAFLSSGQGVSELDVEDVTLLVDAGVAAVVLTLANALRRGETRFGVGADEPAA